MQTDAACDLMFSGVLLEDAQARTVLLDGEGHHVPALCFTVELNSATRAHAQVRQLFPPGEESACQHAAHRLKRGMAVEFQGPAVGITLRVDNASHVHALAPTDPIKPQEPTQ